MPTAASVQRLSHRGVQKTLAIQARDAKSEASTRITALKVPILASIHHIHILEDADQREESVK